jgi:UDPglucose--hexose-1-phosphate uridylyltransferase
MRKQLLTKPDGRVLALYARDHDPNGRCAPSPEPLPQPRTSHLRWHPLRGEWVVYASHRQHRTFLPPPSYNPFAPACNPDAPTEVPDGDWDVAVFENLFPAFTAAPVDPPPLVVPTEPARGVCEVVVFTQDTTASLGSLPLWHIALIVDVWADRYVALAARGDIQYVFPFENRGAEVGVTLHHPHGQIYGYPFVPPVPQAELENQARHFELHGRGLLEDFVAREVSDGVRMIYEGPHVAAFVPVCARYAYEVWVAPYRPVPSFAALMPAERLDFAAALKTVLLKLDGLWDAPMPYVMAIHQAPTDGQPHPESHLHAELCPAYRMPGRLKYLAGSELGAGVFTADTLPECTVQELQAIPVDLNG